MWHFLCCWVNAEQSPLWGKDTESHKVPQQTNTQRQTDKDRDKFTRQPSVGKSSYSRYRQKAHRRQREYEVENSNLSLLLVTKGSIFISSLNMASMYDKLIINVFNPSCSHCIRRLLSLSLSLSPFLPSSLPPSLPPFPPSPNPLVCVCLSVYLQLYVPPKGKDTECFQ